MGDKPLVFVHPARLGIDRVLTAYTPTFLPASPDERARFLVETAPEIEAACGVGSIGMPEEFMAAATKLRLIACFGAGYDHFDVPALKARGITVTNCPNINAEDVADLGVGLMLSVLRRIAQGDMQVKRGQWRGEGQRAPHRIRGRKLGIVGLGAIGAAFAKRGEAFGMQIAWHGPRPRPQAPYSYVSTLIDLARWSDVLAICCRADPGTDRMIDGEILAALGADGVLVNVARGSIVDEAALIAALKSGTIAGAGLDVFEHEPTDHQKWLDAPNTTLTPHIAGGTRESLIETSRLVVENLRRFFADEPLASPIQ